MLLVQIVLLTVVVVFVPSQHSIYLTFFLQNCTTWNLTSDGYHKTNNRHPSANQPAARKMLVSFSARSRQHLITLQRSRWVFIPFTPWLQLNWGHLFYPVSSRLIFGHILYWDADLYIIHLYNIHWILDVLNGEKVDVDELIAGDHCWRTIIYCVSKEYQIEQREEPHQCWFS